MAQRTTGWTEGHWQLVGLLVTVTAACMAAVLEEPPVIYMVVVAVLAASAASLFFDAYGGVLVGLVAAAGLIGARQLTDHWGRSDFGPALVESLALVAAGVAGGAVATTLRSRQSTLVDPHSGAFGSLGLLSLEAAEGRLQEELERSERYRRPLTLAVFGTIFTRDDLEGPTRMNALRAVARIVENRASETDVPFAITADRVGLILPETEQAMAWERVGLVLDALEQATFTAGDVRVRVPVTEVADTVVGIVEAGPGLATPQDMLEGALASLQDGREQALGS